MKMRFRSFKLLCVIGLFGIIALFGLSLFTSGVDARSTQSSQHTSNAISSPHPGIPAIAPYLPATKVSIDGVISASVHITTDMVKAYIEKTSFPSGPVVLHASQTIVSIDFITSREASKRLRGEQIGLTDNAPVCFVKLHGPFTTTYVHVPPGGHFVNQIEYGVEVFDAATGNLLLWGTE